MYKCTSETTDEFLKLHQDLASVHKNMMATGRTMHSEYCEDDEKDILNDPDLKISNTPDFPVSHSLKLESIPDPLSWTAPSFEIRSSKRKQVEQDLEESIGSSGGFYSGASNLSTDRINRLPRLNFRDHVWIYTERYLAVEAMGEAAASIMGNDENEATEEGSRDAMKLVQQLIACAEAVACRDKTHSSTILSDLKSKALVLGTSFQRVASCFVQGLSDRLALVQPLGAVGVVGQSVKPMVLASEREEALGLAYEICPYLQFGHFIANASILEAFEGESSVHVVDLDMTLGLPHGNQWRHLMHSLANQSRKSPPHLRITGVGNCSERLQAIGFELEHYAKGLGMHFEFMVVESGLENLRVEELRLREGEVLVINSILHLHCVVKESRGALNSVLQKLHKLSPKLLVLVEQDSSHNGPFFLGRFMEALHYYSAIFDALDAMLPKYDTRRAKIEQFFYAEEIKNIVSCEGPARTERHERIDQWRRRMSRAGFQPSPINKMLSQAKQWLGKGKFCEGYTVTEEKGCLLLGWYSKPMIAASCWKWS